MRTRRRARRVPVIVRAWVWIAACSFGVTPLGAQTAGSISGTVTNEAGQPLSGVQVSVPGTGREAFTNAEGRYAIAGVESGARVVRAQRLGYATSEQEVTVVDGEAVSLDFVLDPDALVLEGLVVTGVAGETSKTKLPFSVGTVNATQLAKAPAASDPVSALQGRVAGAQVVRDKGTPGSGVSVQLRGITSVTGEQDPLYIVDGVYLDGDLVDLDALDIENIEIVKGAAAASIYGSRAENGVVRITTKRGRELVEGQTRIAIRSEFGFNQLANKYDLSRHHNRLMADSAFVGADGVEVQPGDWLRIDGNGNFLKADLETVDTDDEINGLSFADNAYPVFNDHHDTFFSTQGFARTSADISHNSQSTNFFFSFGNVDESGVVRSAKGYTRQNVRLNVDHRLASDLELSASAYLSSSDRDEPAVQGEIFSAPLFISPAVNLLERDENGNLFVQPDPGTLYENPLYRIENRDHSLERRRALGNVKLGYTPRDWLSLEGTLGYNRLDDTEEGFWDIGYETSRVEDPIQHGRYVQASTESEHWDASASATFSQTFFGDLVTRTRLMAITEKSRNSYSYAAGNDLAAKGVRGLANVEGELETQSDRTDVRSVYGLVATQLDFRDRYIADLLVRRDGSSAFGPDERWHNYFRASGAYRISAEPWWPFKDQINEFKLRYSYGTAGGQPAFDAQYETYRVTGGKIVRGNLGNASLKPEYQVEQEFGLDFALFDRVSAVLSYAKSRVVDQLIQVPLPGSYGFGTQWQNAGTVESNTYEATLDAVLLQRNDLRWSAGLVFSKSESKITEFGRNAFRTGPDGLFRYGEGEEFGAMYGARFVASADELPDHIQTYADQFQVNDEGYLVAVGTGNSWQDGIGKQLWGTMVDVDGDGIGDYQWGMPIIGETYAPIGNTMPDFTVGASTGLTWRGLDLFMLWDSQIGGDIFNFLSFFTIPRNVAAATDQSGRADELKKPTAYYAQFQGFNERHVEDASYIKLRELSLSYDLNADAVSRLFGGRVGNLVSGIRLGVTGRNLLTFTDYTGYDPEVGSPGHGTEFRYATFEYPNFRTFTGTIEVRF